MSIEYQNMTAKFDGFVSVDEADQLLQWLQENPKGCVNLADCRHMHAANLQVLMAAKPAIIAWPDDVGWCGWLTDALESK